MITQLIILRACSDLVALIVAKLKSHYINKMKQKDTSSKPVARGPLHFCLIIF